MTASLERSTRFHELHETGSRGPLVLPNAWDALSARAMEEAGAEAIGTTSGGVSWSLGFPDGERVTLAVMIDAVSRIVAAVRVPVTADMESGYGSGSPADVAEAVRRVTGAGAVGINLEDSPGREGESLLEVGAQCRRLEAGRAAAEREGVRLFINARIDTYLRGVGDPAIRPDETTARARAYLDAGADGYFVPGVLDADVVAHLAGGVDAPLNIMATPDAPAVQELARLGVARISLGTGVAQKILADVRNTTAAILDTGEFHGMRGGLSFPEANGMFGPPEVVA